MVGISGVEKRELEELREEERNKLRIEFQEYDYLVELVCVLELWFKHNYGTSGNDRRRLRYFDRYPPPIADAGDYGPDFTVLFENGYALVGEVKRQVYPDGEGRRETLAQIDKYATIDFPIRSADEEQATVVPDQKDVVLIVSLTNAVNAISVMDQERNSDESTFPEDQPTVLGEDPDERRGPENVYWWNIVWHDLPGNCQFSSPNVLSPTEMQSNTVRLDLNEQFCNDHVPMRVERQNLLQHKADVSFCSDEPPALYALVRKVWRYICVNFVASLSAAEQDKWHQQREIDADLSVQEMVNVLTEQMPPGSVREGWIRSALDLLCEINWARKRDQDTYRLDFTKPKQVGGAGGEQDYFMRRLSVARTQDSSPSDAQDETENDSGQMTLFAD